MTPEEKAKELIKIARSGMTGPGIEANDRDAPKMAAKWVKVLLKELEQLRKPEYTTFVTSYEKEETMDGYEKISYWQSVLTILKTK